MNTQTQIERPMITIPRGGRPPLLPWQRRKSLTIRLLGTERLILERKAADAGLSVGKYIVRELGLAIPPDCQ